MPRRSMGAFGRTVRILGTHGVPAAYGGFETAAENVARYLRDHGWRVIVYCQERASGPIREDEWNGIERVIIPVDRDGWLGTSTFDFMSIRHALSHRDLCLTFGYNTAVFNVAATAEAHPQRHQHGRHRVVARALGLLPAGHPLDQRADRLLGRQPTDRRPPRDREVPATRARASKITTITYGADAVVTAPVEPVDHARPRARRIPHADLPADPRELDPRARRGLLRDATRRTAGRARRLRTARTSTTGAVLDAASDEVVFLGAIYEPAEVEALRFHSIAYLHGHTVGGTNPSLVEAMAAGNAVIAHDNPYNRWVAQDGALYFTDADDADDADHRPARAIRICDTLAAAQPERHAEEFTWEHVAGQYEALLRRYVAAEAAEPVTRFVRKGECMIRVGVVGLGKMGLSHLADDPGAPGGRGRRGRRLDALPARRPGQVHRMPCRSPTTRRCSTRRSSTRS